MRMEKLTRRSFVKGAAAASAVVAAGAAMAGCGSNDTSANLLRMQKTAFFLLSIQI